jgi:hypothetical protein
MPRTVGLVAIMIFAAMAAGASWAQPLPKCDKPGILQAIRIGRFPNLVGCPGAYADRANQLLNYRFQIDRGLKPDADAKPGMVIDQSQDGRLIRLTLAAHVNRDVQPTQPDTPTQKCPDGSAVPAASTCPPTGGDTSAKPVPAAGPGNSSGPVDGTPANVSQSPATPATVSVTYKIIANGPAIRGSDLRFTIFRTGPLGFARLQYNVAQQEQYSMVAAAASPFIDFQRGEDRAGLVIKSNEYDACADPPTVTLSDGAGTKATAVFSNPPAPECITQPPPTLWQVLIDWIDQNWPLVIGSVALVGAVLLDWYFKPFVGVHPSCEITAGEAALQPTQEPASQWPKVTADAEIEAGDLYVTQPLPRSEELHG